MTEPDNNIITQNGFVEHKMDPMRLPVTKVEISDIVRDVQKSDRLDTNDHEANVELIKPNKKK